VILLKKLFFQTGSISLKALFLDRDGVINKEKHYLYKIDDFEFIDGIFELCKFYQNNGFIIIVITNQSGIARGYYDDKDFTLLTNWMIDEFKKRDIDIAKVYHCPHHPDFTKECGCRKPDIGLILEAKEEFGLNLHDCVLVGDKISDIDAAKKADIKTAYLFDNGGCGATLEGVKTIHSFKEIC